ALKKSNLDTKEGVNMSKLSKHVEILKNSLLIAAGEALNYSWDSEYKIKNIQSMIQYSIDDIDKLLKGRLKTLKITHIEMNALNFGVWDDKSDLRLIPIWLAPFINQDVQVTSISGNTTILKDADRDHRGGYIAFGVEPIEEEE
ncbi:MAG: hypothetical protein RSB44_00175, partial [Carnobacterium sp.]